MKAIDLLIKYNACTDAKKWVGDMTVSQAWLTCHRGDWMLWLYAKMYPDNLKELTLAKGHCANTVRHLMKDQRSLDAVDAAIAFGDGKISREELNSKAVAAADDAAADDDDAAAAYAADPDPDPDAAAAYAADAAVYASASLAAAEAVYASAAYAYASAAAYAAEAAAYASAAAYAAEASAAERQKNQQQTADICRKYLTICTH